MSQTLMQLLYLLPAAFILWRNLHGGGAVALIGLVEKATWNGRILWFFVPRDWSGATIENATIKPPAAARNSRLDNVGLDRSLIPSSATPARRPRSCSARRGALRAECACAYRSGTN